jgi:hypothetical protein
MIRDGNGSRDHLRERIVPLNSNQVKTRKPGAYADGGGLYLHVREGGERLWAFRFTAPDGRRAVMETPASAPPATRREPIASTSKRMASTHGTKRKLKPPGV